MFCNLISYHWNFHSLKMFFQRPRAVPLFHLTQTLAEIPWHVLKHSVINQILFVQNHFPDCPRYPLCCEKCGKENIPRNEVSSILLEMWHTLSDLHQSGPHKWTVLFPYTDWLPCRRKVKSFCPTGNFTVIKKLELRGLLCYYY